MCVPQSASSIPRNLRQNGGGGRESMAGKRSPSLTNVGYRPGREWIKTRRPASESSPVRARSGDSDPEALRVLKRLLTDVVYAALLADLAERQQPEPTSNSATAA